VQRISDWWRRLPRIWQIGIGVAVGMAVVLMGWGLLTPLKASPPGVVPTMRSSSATGNNQTGARTPLKSGESHSGSEVSHPTRIFVDIQGAVNHPGLYQFTSEMRVADALKAAGGLVPRADRRQVNLAARLTDQQQLYLPLKGEKAPAAATQTTGTKTTSESTTTVVNLNSASVTELQQLTGIGEKKAEKIVAYRNDHGSFQSVKDLAQVPGFGDKTVANLADQLTT